MKKQVYISGILKFLAILVCIILLSACGNDREMRTVGQSPDGGSASWEALDHTCWKGKLLEDIYEMVGKTSMNMYPKLIEGAMAMMMIAFAFWLGFRFMKYISSFSEESAAEVWTEILQKLFLCFVCGLLASSTTSVLFVLNTVIFPIYNAFLELGSAMIGHINKNNITVLDKSWNVPLAGNETMTHSLVCKAGVLSKATVESGFPLEPQKMMSCLVCAVSQRLNFGFKLGFAIMLKMPLVGILMGLFMIFIVLIVKVSFAFYLIDTLFRLFLMLMILPLLIMAYPFKTTRNWVKIGFLTILNSASFLMMIAIIISLVMLGMQQTLEAYNGWIMLGIGEEKGLGGLDDLGVPFLVILMIILLLVSSVKIAKSINDTLIGGGGEASFQKKIAAAGAAAIRVAGYAFGGKAAADAAAKIGEKLKDAANNGGST